MSCRNRRTSFPDAFHGVITSALAATPAADGTTFASAETTGRIKGPADITWDSEEHSQYSSSRIATRKRERTTCVLDAPASRDYTTGWREVTAAGWIRPINAPTTSGSVNATHDKWRPCGLRALGQLDSTFRHCNLYAETFNASCYESNKTFAKSQCVIFVCQIMGYLFPYYSPGYASTIHRLRDWSSPRSEAKASGWVQSVVTTTACYVPSVIFLPIARRWLQHVIFFIVEFGIARFLCAMRVFDVRS